MHLTKQSENFLNLEVWADVPGYGNHFQASSMGRIKSKARCVIRKHSKGSIQKFYYKEKILKPTSSDKYGHLRVHIGYNKIKVNVFVHRLVLMAFVGECPTGMECCHLNGDAKDNRIENLRWDTHYQNNQDRKRHGKYASKDSHHGAKLTAEHVASIRESSLSVNKLTTLFDISKSQIYRIKRNQSWVL